MCNKLPTIILAALALTPPALAADAPAPGEATPSNTLRSHRTLTILWERDAPAPDLDRVRRRLLEESSIDSLAKNILHVSPGAAVRCIDLDRQLVLSPGECKLMLHVELKPTEPGLRPAAREFTDALVQEMSRLLEEDRRGRVMERLKRENDEAQRSAAHLDEAQARVKQLQVRLRGISGRSDLSPQTFEAALSKLEDERQRLELELAGMQARMEAAEEQFKKGHAEAAAIAKDDPVLPELERAVALRQEMLDRLHKLNEAGQAQAADVSAAEAALVDARIQLLDRRQSTESKRGETLSGLNRELQNLSIDLRDREARLGYVKKRLEPLRQGGDMLQELIQAQEERQAFQKEHQQAQERLRQLERQAEDSPVDRVIVTNASDEAAAQ